MAFPEALVHIDPRDVPKPNRTLLELEFGGDALFIDRFMLWASTTMSPNLPIRSMLLYITTDPSLRIYTARRLEFGLPFIDLKSGEIKPFPYRISHNPKRRQVWLGTDYDIVFHHATGGFKSREGSLFVTLNSRKPIGEPESVSPTVDFPQELAARLARTGTAPHVVR